MSGRKRTTRFDSQRILLTGKRTKIGRAGKAGRPPSAETELEDFRHYTSCRQAGAGTQACVTHVIIVSDDAREREPPGDRKRDPGVTRLAKHIRQVVGGAGPVALDK